jgi:hypothetical protein
MTLKFMNVPQAIYADVGLKLMLSLAWFLEVELVKLLIACHLFHPFSRANIRPRSLAIRGAH